MKKKILFISESCLLDQNSGAARSVMELLNGLTDMGWDCEAITMSVCDGRQNRVSNHPIAQINKQLQNNEVIGSFVTDSSQKFKQHIYVTQSTALQNLRPWELKAYLRQVKLAMSEGLPSIVITYSSELLINPLAWAQRLGAQTVFYLANAAFADKTGFSFEYIDHFITPSKALRDLYQQTMGIEPVHMSDIINVRVDADNRQSTRVADRKKRWVMMVNPQPSKGGLFFINLAKQVTSVDPKIRFAAVESRWGRQDWAELGVNSSDLDRIEWLPSTQDMSNYYKQAALLLMPSLGYEASGRVIVEALNWGIPVLAMKNGGIEEQLSQGGFLFDLPANLKDNHLGAPDQNDLKSWVKHIGVLQQDDKIYQQAVELAYRAASAHDPILNQAKYAHLFEEWIRAPLFESMDLPTREALKKHNTNLRKKRIEINETLESKNEHTTQVGPEKEPYHELILMSMRQPAMKEVTGLMKIGDYKQALTVLDKYVRLIPEDIVALGLLAESMNRLDRHREAIELMTRIIQLAPGFLQGYQQLIKYLNQTQDQEKALEYSFLLIEKNPMQYSYLALHASLLVAAKRFYEAIDIYEAIFKQVSGSDFDWLHYAQAKAVVGEEEVAIQVFRKVLGAHPEWSNIWFELSNMKSAIFDALDIQKMESLIADEKINDKKQRSSLHFALGKAYEDHQSYEKSFSHYEKANQLRRSSINFDITDVQVLIDSVKATVNQQWLNKLTKLSNSDERPIFILGLHRSGTTLVEQILSSHSHVEGTRELPYMLHIAQELSVLNQDGQKIFNQKLINDLGRADLRLLANQYIYRVSRERRTPKSIFTDKQPNNWLNIWLIYILFPKAKIIDIRKDPMSAGFSLYKMNFTQGVDHAFDQKEIAQYYKMYANYMKYIDKLMPGKIHHIQYEQLVKNTAAEIQSLLEFCELPHEDSCFKHWELSRAVQTPSSQQVRKPIYDDALEQWKNYAQWLAPMQEAFNNK